MNSSHLVAQRILGVVLHLLGSSDVLHLFAGSFEQIIGGHLIPSHHQVQAGSDLLQLHPGVFSAGLAQVDLVAPQQNLLVHSSELKDVLNALCCVDACRDPPCALGSGVTLHGLVAIILLYQTGMERAR